jgi:hypothetical protein
MENPAHFHVEIYTPMSQSLGKMARKGTDTGWTSKLAQFHLHASACRNLVQSRSKSQVRSSGGCWEREKGRFNGRHAQTACPRKCFTARSTEMDRKAGLTKTDTPRATAGLPCEGVRSTSRHPHAGQTSNHHADVFEPTCSASITQRPS